MLLCNDKKCRIKQKKKTAIKVIRAYQGTAAILAVRYIRMSRKESPNLTSHKAWVQISFIADLL